jgi:hypothetical protein
MADADFMSKTGSVGLSLIGQNSAEVSLKWKITGRPGSSLAELDRRTVMYRGDRLTFAGLGDPPRSTYPLMIWWAILYVLSMLTRYEPEGWAKVVDVNTSPDAVPVEFLLEEALSVIPEEMHRAILQVGS